MSGERPMAPGSGEPDGRAPYMISSDCMNCGVCEFMCSEGAIIQAPRQFIIDKRLCDGCADCVPYCPAEAIVPRANFSERQADTVRARLKRVLDQQ